MLIRCFVVSDPRKTSCHFVRCLIGIRVNEQINKAPRLANVELFHGIGLQWRNTIFFVRISPWFLSSFVFQCKIQAKTATRWWWVLPQSMLITLSVVLDRITAIKVFSYLFWSALMSRCFMGTLLLNEPWRWPVRLPGCFHHNSSSWSVLATLQIAHFLNTSFYTLNYLSKGQD